MVVPGIMYDERILPTQKIILRSDTHTHTQTDQTTLPRGNNRDIRWTLCAAPRTDVLKVRLEISFGEPRLSKAHSLFFFFHMNVRQ